ncbi:MAG: VWA domain-containing protein [Microscillaceae bacterium]|nr:VWA domain-containing protein [Microscillaceae bacterium]
MKNLRKMLLCTGLALALYACGSGGDGESSGEKQTTRTQKDVAKEEVPAMAEQESVAEEAAPAPPEPHGTPAPNTESYQKIEENPFVAAQQQPVSTFSIDVDNAAYSNIRRYLQQQNQLPPADAVRIEEMVNYFSYNYPNPSGPHPFSITTEVAQCPWNPQHQLVHIGLQGKKLNYSDLKPSNLVFLVDASGSMQDANKLPLLKKSLALLLDQLSQQDRIAIVAYAGAAGLVLPSTPASQKSNILSALNQLEAGGSTAGGEGIELAYRIARENFIKGGNNRVILATDGDFNVGASSAEELVALIEQKRKEGVYLTLCGFGMGNYKDGQMEALSNAGNGNYFYIDDIREARKVFVTEMRANLFTIAKDVKIQVAFNPQLVKAYRLIGYENRRLNNEDFEDDTKDAGELGAGHSVTALYEIIPGNSPSNQVVSRQQGSTPAERISLNAETLLGVRLRYKPIGSEQSVLLSADVKNKNQDFAVSSLDFRFSAAVAGFGLLLRNSAYKGQLRYEDVIKMGKTALGKDPDGYRAEFIRLVETAKLLK